MKILEFLYNSLKKDDLCLKRKFRKQLEAIKIYEECVLKTKLWRETESRLGRPLKTILYRLMVKDKLNGVQIADKLGIHSSTVYRWLKKTEVRQPVKRRSEEWLRRVCCYQN